MTAGLARQVSCSRAGRYASGPTHQTREQESDQVTVSLQVVLHTTGGTINQSVLINRASGDSETGV